MLERERAGELRHLEDVATVSEKHQREVGDRLTGKAIELVQCQPFLECVNQSPSVIQSEKMPILGNGAARR